MADVMRLFTPYRLFLLSWILRLILILYGELQDRLMTVKFTDIDYRVFSDASAHIIKGTSPFDRHTYRYTPLLAWLLVPNHILFYSFGKVVFVTLDVMGGWIMYKILQLDKISQSNRLIAISMFWLFNPLTAVVSSRGNAESIMAFLLLLCLYTLIRGGVFTSAVLYGLAVHMKIYPIIYSLPLVIKLGPTPWERVPGKITRFNIRWNHIITYKRLQFVVISLVTYSLLTLLCYWLYGWEYIHEALLYHITRTDIKHNFSVYFYMLYLTHGTWVSPLVSLASFLPQLVLVLISGVKYYNDLPFCFFVQTFLFVTFNKVCTSQYFLWYLTFLPLVVPSLSAIKMKEAFIMLIVWFGAQGMWLFSAYLLEYHGLNTFLFVWIAGLVFFGVNIWIITTIVNKYKKKTTKQL